MKKLLRDLIFFVFGIATCIWAANSAFAQMHRCGNVYQDRPCDDAKAGKQVQGAGTRSTEARFGGAAQGAPNQECSQRGVESQKIVWTREAGDTEEKQLAGESNPARRKLISDVYRVRGSAPQVRARIESECEAEMAEKAKLIALHQSMVRAGVLPAQKGAPAGPSPAELEVQREQQAKAAAQRQAEDTKAKCDRLSKVRDGILAQQRTGGGAAYMDGLNRQRTSLDNEMHELRCAGLR